MLHRYINPLGAIRYEYTHTVIFFVFCVFHVQQYVMKGRSNSMDTGGMGQELPGVPNTDKVKNTHVHYYTKNALLSYIIYIIMG